MGFSRSCCRDWSRDAPEDNAERNREPGCPHGSRRTLELPGLRYPFWEPCCPWFLLICFIYLFFCLCTFSDTAMTEHLQRWASSHLPQYVNVFTQQPIFTATYLYIYQQRSTVPISNHLSIVFKFVVFFL